MIINEKPLLGRKGEQETVNFLLRQGYTILERNWRHKRMEIDIIAKQEKVVVFIEVKTRTNSRTDIKDTVSIFQQNRIIEAAHQYIITQEIDEEIRFDLVLVDANEKSFKFAHHKEFIYPTIQ